MKVWPNRRCGGGGVSAQRLGGGGLAGNAIVGYHRCGGIGEMAVYHGYGAGCCQIETRRRQSESRGRK